MRRGCHALGFPYKRAWSCRSVSKRNRLASPWVRSIAFGQPLPLSLCYAHTYRSRFFSLTMADTALPGGATSKPNLQVPDVSDGRASVSVAGVSEDEPLFDRRNQKEEPLLFSFGAIADVQYGDLDDGWNYNKTYRRYYRAALLKLKRAVDVWIRDETHRFVLQLGDVIDGLNSDGHSEAALNTVKQEIDRLAKTLPLGVLNSLGNHELYNFSKQRWAREIDCSSFSKAVRLTLSAVPRAAGNQKTAVSQADNGAPPTSTNDVITSAKERFYYSFCPHEAFRFVALDTFDLNAICGDGPEGVDLASCSTGVRMLTEKNTNENKSDFAGMDGLERRYVRYNGGVGKEQLSWLEGELHEASLSGQRVIGFGHVPLHPGDTLDHVLLWNYQDVLDVFNRFDCVVAFISGHRHRDTYWVDNGVHHVSLGAVLEAPPDQEAFANVDVYPDRLELRGHGVVASRTMRFSSTSSALAVQTPELL